ncbi:site-specific integrase [Pseudomonas coleopterorum]|uniref:site-specific integrase n=1 Tax=Pseudomonas coleopterorum TaxID=1605838 RepID=UPI00177F89AC|nr:site-specific integrase [Pseudomonas coleopterorum]MBD8480357.1 site-specific integrase [Pseudomonas coleopterorum]
MPEKHIAKLRTVVYQRYHKAISRETPGKQLNLHIINTLKYLYSRRMFTINMMTNFGLRPEELQEMPIDENSNIISTLTVCLPTKKTRASKAVRRLKINMGLAISLQSYFDDRAEFVSHITTTSSSTLRTSATLLGKNGSPLNKASLTKEFDRLCDDAGLSDRKVCLSMFRHRFISREVKSELLLRFRKNPELMGELSSSLKESVARTVIAKTGHLRPKSIWTYVDEQYKLLTTPDSHESFQTIKDDLEQTKNTLEDLLFRQKFSSEEQVAGELKLLRKYIRGLEERLYAAERTAPGS